MGCLSPRASVAQTLCLSNSAAFAGQLPPRPFKSQPRGRRQVSLGRPGDLRSLHHKSAHRPYRPAIAGKFVRARLRAVRNVDCEVPCPARRLDAAVFQCKALGRESKGPMSGRSWRALVHEPSCFSWAAPVSQQITHRRSGLVPCKHKSCSSAGMPEAATHIRRLRKEEFRASSFGKVDLAVALHAVIMPRVAAEVLPGGRKIKV